MQVGQHVVYIKSGKMRKCIPLVPNKVYTIRDLWIALDGTPCLYLVEVKNRLKLNEGGTFGRELGYKRSSFRPLTKLSVEDFTKIEEPIDA